MKIVASKKASLPHHHAAAGGLEVIGAHAADGDVVSAVKHLGQRPVGTGEGARDVSPGQGRAFGHGSLFGTGNAAQIGQGICGQGIAHRGVAIGAAEGNGNGQQARRLEAQMIVLHMPESLEQQRRAGEQDHREGDFGRHQDPA